MSITFEHKSDGRGKVNIIMKKNGRTVDKTFTNALSPNVKYAIRRAEDALRERNK